MCRSFEAHIFLANDSQTIALFRSMIHFKSAVTVVIPVYSLFLCLFIRVRFIFCSLVVCPSVLVSPAHRRASFVCMTNKNVNNFAICSLHATNKKMTSNATFCMKLYFRCLFKQFRLSITCFWSVLLRKSEMAREMRKKTNKTEQSTNKFTNIRFFIEWHQNYSHFNSSACGALLLIFAINKH